MDQADPIHNFQAFAGAVFFELIEGDFESIIEFK